MRYADPGKICCWNGIDRRVCAEVDGKELVNKKQHRWVRLGHDTAQKRQSMMIRLWACAITYNPYPHFSTYDHEGEEPGAVVGGAESHQKVDNGGENDGAKDLQNEKWERCRITGQPRAKGVGSVGKT